MGLFLKKKRLDTLLGAPGLVWHAFVSLCLVLCVFMMFLCVWAWARLVGLGAVLSLCLVLEVSLCFDLLALFGVYAGIILNSLTKSSLVEKGIGGKFPFF